MVSVILYSIDENGNASFSQRMLLYDNEIDKCEFRESVEWGIKRELENKGMFFISVGKNEFQVIKTYFDYEPIYFVLSLENPQRKSCSFSFKKIKDITKFLEKEFNKQIKEI